MTLLGVVTGMGGIVCFQGRIVGCVYGRNEAVLCPEPLEAGWGVPVGKDQVYALFPRTLVWIPKDGSVNKGAEGKVQAAARWSVSSFRTRYVPGGKEIPG